MYFPCFLQNQNDIFRPWQDDHNYSLELGQEVFNGQDSNTDLFVISKVEWMKIKPLVKEKHTLRILSKGWTDIMKEKICKLQFLKECEFRFHFNRAKHIKSRNNISGFWTGKCKCKRLSCNIKVKLTIENEPEDDADEINVHVKWKGKVNHTKPPERQPLKGQKRIEMARRAMNIGVNNTYYENLENAESRVLSSENYSAVPLPSVIRKAVSEEIQKEKLHKNCIQEVKLLKQFFRDDDVNPNDGYAGYIQYLGNADPFRVMMFCPSQLELIKKNPRPDLYFDATGTIIRSFKGCSIHFFV